MVMLVSAMLVAMIIFRLLAGGRSNISLWLTVGIRECKGMITEFPEEQTERQTEREAQERQRREKNMNPTEGKKRETAPEGGDNNWSLTPDP